MSRACRFLMRRVCFLNPVLREHCYWPGVASLGRCRNALQGFSCDCLSKLNDNTGDTNRVAHEHSFAFLHLCLIVCLCRYPLGSVGL